MRQLFTIIFPEQIRSSSVAPTKSSSKPNIVLGCIKAAFNAVLGFVGGKSCGVTQMSENNFRVTIPKSEVMSMTPVKIGKISETLQEQNISANITRDPERDNVYNVAV